MPSLPCNSTIASILTSIAVKFTITMTRLTVARWPCQQYWRVRRENRSTRSGVGRDLGYRGGRRTGLALTDDVHIDRHANRWDIVTQRPTIGAIVAERTAAVIWSVLDRIESRIFLWNVFPLHPHEADDPFTNRQHNARERRAGEDLLRALIFLLRPARIIAIGNDATAAANRVENMIPVVCVRHPSYGGQSQFLRQIAELYAPLLPTKILL